MGSDLKGWYCILVAMVTESQNSKSSRTANRRPHPEQANLHRSAGTPHHYAPRHIGMLNTENNYLNTFCTDTFFFCNPLYENLACFFLYIIPSAIRGPVTFKSKAITCTVYDVALFMDSFILLVSEKATQ